MASETQSAAARTFATPELFEQILTYLLDDILPISHQEDPRSVRTRNNARILLKLMRYTEVNRTWLQCMQGSKRLQRALFLLPDNDLGRSWEHQTNFYKTSIRARHAPVLNPVIQVLFPAYHYRFWHLSLEASMHRYTAYLIITRKDLPALQVRSQSGQGRTISSMFISQPPCKAFDTTIWEERDETREYIGRTTVLKEPRISDEVGLTLGMVHERVARMFAEHPDVAAIKLTTV